MTPGVRPLATLLSPASIGRALDPFWRGGRFRRIDPSGRISTLASLPQVAGVTVDAAGAVYASALEPGRLVAVDPATGAVRELAG